MSKTTKDKGKDEKTEEHIKGTLTLSRNGNAIEFIHFEGESE